MANPFTLAAQLRRGVTIIPQDAPGVPGSITTALALVTAVHLDATTQQSHPRSARVTEFPAGLGSTVSDHIVRDAEVVNISGLFTDTPVRFLAGVQNLTIGLETGTLNRDLRSRAEVLWDTCEEFWRRRRFLTISTSVRSYEDMVFESLEAVRDSDTGGAIGVSFTARKIRLVSTAFSEAITDTAAALGGGSGTADLGSQGAKVTG